jgi:predicted phage tail protein
VIGPIEGQGGKGGSSSSSTPTEAQNTLRSTSTARVIDLVSEGEIVGLVDGLKSVFFDGTPLVDSTGRSNFANVTVDGRTGTPDQAPLDGFPDVEAEVSVGLTVLQATPVVQTIGDTNADRARVTVRIPALWTADSKTGNVNPGSLALKIEAKSAAGAYQLMVDETIQGKCVAPYDKSYAFNVADLGAGPWSVKVTRVSPDYDSVSQAGDLVWSSYTTIIDHRLIYPDSALFGTICDAQSFGGRIPKRSFLIDGIKMQVPSNYDPVARTYDGIWDGTFKTAFSNNPAWVFYMVATNKRFGLGEFLSASQTDKWNLYQIGVYCDGQVPDGLGGMEPRYTCNGVIADRDDAYRVLTSLASVFRGMVYWSSGTVVATADMPSDPVKLVNQTNVVDGTFSYEGQALKARHSVVLVTWNDPSDNYQPNIEVVEDAELIDKFGYRPLEITAILCSSRGQARRSGKWVLETEKDESEAVTYACSWDHADLFPGNLIDLADPAYAGLRMGGRLTAIIDLKTLQLDAEVDLISGQVYSLDVVMPDGSIATRTVSGVVGTTDVIPLMDDLPKSPLAGAVWVLTSSEIAPRPFRVLGVNQTDKHLFSVSGLLHSPGKYDRVENDLIVEDPTYTALPAGPLRSPGSIQTSQYLYRAVDAVAGTLSASWGKSSDARVVRFELQAARNGLDFVRVYLGENTGFDLTDIARTETTISLRVRSLDTNGRTSAWVAATGIALDMFTAAPADITGLHGAAIGDTTLLSWAASTNRNADHYVVRYSSAVTSASWGAAQEVSNSLSSPNASVATRNGTYLVKAVSLAGIESANAAEYVTGGQLAVLNAVEVVNDAPTWAGTKVHTVVDTGTLKLEEGFTEGTYMLGSGVDLGAIYTSRVSVDLTVFGESRDDTMTSWATLAEVETLSGVGSSNWSVLFEERHTDDDPAGSPAWSEWAPLSVNDISARAFDQTRVTLKSVSENITPVVSEAAVTIDMPDRHVADKDITSGTSGGGFQILFDPPFHSLKGVTVSYTQLAAGDHYKWLSKDNEQATIVFYDASGTVVSRSFDFDAIGYGLQAS